MARAATTTDVFNAVAEPRRRQILTLLAKRERPVHEIVHATRLTQPQVSKHLRVLREVGLVSARGDGQLRVYSLNPKKLKPMHDWVSHFEHAWNEQFDRLDHYLTMLQAKEKPHDRT